MAPRKSKKGGLFLSIKRMSKRRNSNLLKYLRNAQTYAGEEIYLERKEIYLLLAKSDKPISEQSWDEKIKAVEKEISSKRKKESKVSTISIAPLKRLVYEIKERWAKATRNVNTFYNRNKEWLKGTIKLKVHSSQKGQYSAETSTSKEGQSRRGTKRCKTGNLLGAHSTVNLPAEDEEPTIEDPVQEFDSTTEDPLQGPFPNEDSSIPPDAHILEPHQANANDFPVPIETSSEEQSKKTHRKRSYSEISKVFQAIKSLKSSDPETDVCRSYGDYVANKLRTYDSRTRAEVESKISRIFHEIDTQIIAQRDLNKNLNAHPGPSDSSQETVEPTTEHESM